MFLCVDKSALGDLLLSRSVDRTNCCHLPATQQVQRSQAR